MNRARANDLERRLADGPETYFGAPLPALPASCRPTRRSAQIVRSADNPNRAEDVLFRLLCTVPRYVASLEIERWHRDGTITLGQRHVMWMTAFGASPPNLDDVA